ncbi:MAG: hypothetical protein FWD31_09905 [Planctomycetaceae bacterium]|nr:hypothetical protein [Planctomycetaceae bacterium]
MKRMNTVLAWSLLLSCVLGIGSYALWGKDAPAFLWSGYKKGHTFVVQCVPAWWHHEAAGELAQQGGREIEQNAEELVRSKHELSQKEKRLEELQDQATSDEVTLDTMVTLLKEGKPEIRIGGQSFTRDEVLADKASLERRLAECRDELVELAEDIKGDRTYCDQLEQTIVRDVKRLTEFKRKFKSQERLARCDERGEPKGSESLERAHAMLDEQYDEQTVKREAQAYIAWLRGDGPMPVVAQIQREEPVPVAEKPEAALPVCNAIQREAMKTIQRKTTATPSVSTRPAR